MTCDRKVVIFCSSSQSGIDPKTVAEILGHASAEFSLDVYTHVTAGMKKEAAQKISGFMASVG